MVLNKLARATREVGDVTHADAIVPVRNVVLLPLEADVKLLCSGDDLVEIPNNGITFGLGYSNNGLDKAWVEEERLPPRHRVSANDWMLRDDWFSADWTTECS